MATAQSDEGMRLFSREELDRLRGETPLIATGRLHLNHAGASPPPEPVLAAVAEYLDEESRCGGYETTAARRDDVESVYEAVASLIGSQPHQVALVENATAAFGLALSSFDFAPGQRIVTSRSDYVSNHLMFLILEQRRGVELVVVADDPAGGIDVGELSSILERLTGDARGVALVTLSWMPTNSGLLQPAAAVGAVCRSYEVPFLVDACQVVGQCEIDIDALQCDFLAATGRKYLRGPRGTGFLWVAQQRLEEGRHPMTLDLGGADWVEEKRFQLRDDARRFETWEKSYALLMGLGAAARYANDVGLDRIAQRSARLASRVRLGLAEIPGCRVLDCGKELGAIVSVAIGDAGRGTAAAMMRDLSEAGIHTSVTERSSALFEFDRLEVQEALRVSPHYVNTEEEIDHAVARIGERLHAG